MLRARLATVGALTVAAALVISGPVTARPPSHPDGSLHHAYRGEVTPGQLAELRKFGLDHEDLSVGAAKDGKVAVEAVLTSTQAAKLAKTGIKLAEKPSSRKSLAAGPTVFRSYSQPGGIRDELVKAAADHPGIAKLEQLGSTVQGKPIYAVKVSRQARVLPDGLKPAVVYSAAQHAREWITPEMVRRLMHQMLDGYGKDPEVTEIVNSRELYFLPVANPDGYDYTFSADRLWRKNLRDNNGDGQITSVDGVDPNRNFSSYWGYDNEGSSDDPANDTYRGTKPQSEPETQALDGLVKRVRPKYLINYHSAAELLLYGTGFQVSTPTPDDVVYEALLGDDAHPAVPGYDPDISAELYTTNGETTEHMQKKYGVLAITPEMSTCETASNLDPDDQWNADDCESVFNFPDDEKLIKDEYQKNVPLALAVAKSAGHPDTPVSVVGRTTADFVVDAFDTSYGTTQTVAAIARKSLLLVRMNYKVNGGPTKTVLASTWKGGSRYGQDGTDYYDEMRAKVGGTKAGDHVEVWFSAFKLDGWWPKTVSSSHFTYGVASDIGGDVLVLAAEDVTGLSPAQTGTSAHYAGDIVAALTAAGYTSDVYDLDVNGRKPPHPLGVLSHYKAVVWETGDDIIPRAPGQVGGTAAKSALDTELAVRDYLNEGGKLLLSGQYAEYAQGQDGAYYYNPYAPPECTTPGDYPCLQLFNDFQQYWLGAYNYVSDGGTDPEGNPYPLTGNAGAFTGFSGALNAAGSAGNQGHTASFLTTSSFLPPAKFPQFGGSSAVDWLRPGGAPFDPHTGSWYVYSGRSDESYKRLTRTVNLTGATSGALKFYTSYDTETDWDFLLVEAHEVGSDSWTTLPDTNGHTSQATGESCPGGWVEALHPFLAHYQGADCSPTGTTGSWNAATGPSNGWQQWSVDLTPYAGKQVEVSISYVSDWGGQGLGVFLDDLQTVVDGAVASDTSVESDLGGWTVAGPPPGSATTGTDFARTQTAFEEGSVVVTRNSVYAGFGLEGLAPAARADFVKRSLKHLLG